MKIARTVVIAALLLAACAPGDKPYYGTVTGKYTRATSSTQTEYHITIERDGGTNDCHATQADYLEAENGDTYNCIIGGILKQD